MPEAIRLRNADVVEMMPDCQSCHRKEYADWHAGPHRATYSEIFTDPSQNKKQRLMDDCLRCHGMYFEGGIRDLVQPQDAKGPWQLVHSELANKPAIPCMACHQVHRCLLYTSGPQHKRLRSGLSLIARARRLCLSLMPTT